MKFPLRTIFPTQLKVGALRYKVVVVDDETGFRGQTDHAALTIKIKKMAQPMMEQTLFHEVMHCINNELSEVESEFLGNAIYQFMEDNV